MESMLRIVWNHNAVVYGINLKTKSTSNEVLSIKQKEYEHFLFVLLFTRLALQRYSMLHLICALSGGKAFK